MFRYKTALLADKIRSQWFESAIVSGLSFPPFSPESSKCLRNMFVTATPVENVTEDQLRSEIAADQKAERQQQQQQEQHAASLHEKPRVGKEGRAAESSVDGMKEGSSPQRKWRLAFMIRKLRDACRFYLAEDEV